MKTSPKKSAKRCATCKLEKSTDEFGAEKRKPDGLKSSCKPCMAEIRRASYLRHRKKRIAATKSWRHRNTGAAAQYMREYRERLRLEVVAGYGGKCTCCGESNPDFLTLEHVNGDGKSHRKERHGSLGTYRHVKRLGFPEQYTVLCMNCNYAKGHRGTCPHTKSPMKTEIEKLKEQNAALVEALKKAVHLLAKVEACEMAEYCGADVGDYLEAAEEGMAALASAKEGTT